MIDDGRLECLKWSGLAHGCTQIVSVAGSFETSWEELKMQIDPSRWLVALLFRRRAGPLGYEILAS